MLATLILLAAAAPQQRVAAVLELRNKLEGADRNLVDAAFLTDVVRQQILEDAPQLKLMTRENVLSLLEASGKKLEECEGECEVDTGRRLGADLVVTGEVLRFGKGYRVNLRLHDTHSAQLLSAAVASGDTPEALEKDLNRAVARLVAPVASGPAPQAKTPEWYETVGLYLTGGINSFSDGDNGTPRALPPPAGSITISNSHPDNAELGLGARYAPLPWLMIDAAFQFFDLAGNADVRTGDGGSQGPQTFSSNSIPLSVNCALRVSHAFRAFAGLGAQWYFGKIGGQDPHGSSVQLTDAPTRISSKLSFVRPLVRAGIEWRPQERFGIDVYGVLYPVPQDIQIYIYDANAPAQTAAPVYTYSAPPVSAHGALVLYF